jgi:transcription-repair coupling factor (superfamily II helicase)
LLKQSVASLKGEKVAPRVDVQVRLDFLALNPTEERDEPAESARIHSGPEPPNLQTESEPEAAAPALGSKKMVRPGELRDSAYIPFNYVSDSRQRVEIYRKIAQATDKSSLQGLEKEIRDRFGPIPEPVGLLMQVAELKTMAAERNIASIEVKEDKLMLRRNNDYIMAGTRFPRLTKKQAAARLKEIKKLLSVLR